MVKFTYDSVGKSQLSGQLTAEGSFARELVKKAEIALTKSPELAKSALSMYKAMDTQTALEGGNLVDTILFRGILERVREFGVVAPLFRDLQMPSAVYQLPVELTDVDIYLTPENTQAVSQTTYSSSNPTVGQAELRAVKFTGRSFTSGELVEDSVIDIIRYIVDSHAHGIALAMDQAILDGDTTATHQDSDVTSDRDVRTGFTGLRKYALAGSLDVNAGGDALSLADLFDAEAKMGKYATGAQLANLALILGQRSYIQLREAALNTANNNQIAFEMTGGRLTSINGYPIVVTEAVRSDLAATGVETGSGALTYALLVNTSQFFTGTRSTLQLESERRPEVDQTELFSRIRKGFTAQVAPSTTYSSVSIIRNIG